jgi:hypothetical protein
MKFDPSIHKHAWRVQKGCRVEWFDGRQKGVGTVKRVIADRVETWGKQPSSVVITDDKSGQDVTITIEKIRILKGK